MKNEKIEADVYACYMLCQSMGYGHAMEIISALWRRDLKSKGIPTDGCFVPALKSTITGRYKSLTEKSNRTYDSIIEKVFEENE